MTTSASAHYPIGTPGVPWGAAERAQWLSRQVRHRSYNEDVVSRLERFSARFDVEEYGRLDYAPDQYRLFAVRNRGWRDDLPVALVTGGAKIFFGLGNSTRKTLPVISFSICRPTLQLK